MGRASHQVTAGTVLVILALAGCAGDAEPADGGTAQATVTTASPGVAGSTAGETSSAEATASAAPTTGGDGYGAWCAALSGSVEDIRGILTEWDGEWSAGTVQVIEPEEGDTFEKRTMCAVRLGPDIDSGGVIVRETQFADEQLASIDPFRDDSDPAAITIEDVEYGDDAVLMTYVVAMGVPPAISYSVILREDDRQVMVQLRDHPAEIATLELGSKPTDEARRREQVLQIADLLEP